MTVTFFSTGIREYFFNHFRQFIANQSFLLSFFTFFQDFRHHSDPRRIGGQSSDEVGRGSILFDCCDGIGKTEIPVVQAIHSCT